MMRSTLLLLLTPVVLTAALLDGGAAQTRLEGFSLSFDTKPQVVRNQPVLIRLTVTNRSLEAVTFDLGRDRKQNVRMEFSGPDGVVRELVAPMPSGVYELGNITLEPGQVLSQQYVLNEWTSVDRIGSYAVRIGVTSPVRTSGGLVLAAPPAQTIRFVVTERDEAELRRICDSWADEIIRGGDFTLRRDAARALSYLTDDAAVPCLARVASRTKDVDNLIIVGLRRIGSVQARGLLQTLAASDDPERVAMSRDALRALTR